MKEKSVKAMVICMLYVISMQAASQNLPSASELVSEMGVGWNLGNSLDAPEGETTWGNPATTQELINGVKAAGFNTIRIPCAWNYYANQQTNEIDQAWLARVKEVVDYCMDNQMYAVINIHWDGGWLEENPTYAAQEIVNKKLSNFWWQIASYFKHYDEHLLFAGTNEVRADYGQPTDEYLEVQESFNQSFIYTVRATGGNNTSRTLIVQSYNTNMWYALNYLKLPNDVIDGRLMVETHYYDPYDFTLNTDNNTACTVWGKPYSFGNGCDYNNEEDVDLIFGLLKEKFVDNGVPVFIGEFGAGKRTSLTGIDYDLHVASRAYFLNYIVESAITNGIVPVYWDNGFNGNMDFGIFNRETGEVIDSETALALLDNQDTCSYSLILNKATGLYIDGMNSLTNASKVGQWSYSNSYNQQWKIEYYDGYVKLQNRNSKLYLDGLYFTHDGANAGQWIKSNSYNQQWIMEANSTGVMFKNRATGLYLDGLWNNSNGDELGQWSYSGSDSQTWYFGSLKSAKAAPSAVNKKANKATNIYPNPFTSFSNITFSEKDNIDKIEVYDALGNLVQFFNKTAIEHKMEIGNELNIGIYIALIYTMNGVESFKIIKSN